MKVHGMYRIWRPFPTAKLSSFLRVINAGLLCPDYLVPNLVTDEGQSEYLKMVFQDVTTIAGGANWYVGLCNQTPAAADTMASISTEPTATNGYARQALVRSAVGWPTVATVNAHLVCRSATITFTASGGSFSAAFTRAFLTSSASGAGGKLYSFSGSLAAAITLAATQSFAMQYETYFE